MAVSAKVGVPVPIALALEDGGEDQYPRARIYVAGEVAVLATVDLVHKALGRYEGSWTPLSVGVYDVMYIVYSDSGHTTENLRYTRQIEQIEVSEATVDDLRTLVLRALGLVHENAFIDNTVFDQYKQLVAARVRVFDSKEHVQAATDGGGETEGLIATYEMATIYEERGKMGSYRMKRI